MTDLTDPSERAGPSDVDARPEAHAPAALAYENNGRPVSRAAFYAIACDPRRSVAVEACAGAGKTWMLVSRILRALLDGCPPHEILAITFTKKAASEMRERLQSWLAEFADATDEQLAEALSTRGVTLPGPPGSAASQALCRALAGLRRSVLLADRPVQIRTFHSWFAALVRSAPAQLLQALGLPANYELLEDDQEAVALVWPRFFAAVTNDAVALADYEALAAQHGRSQTHKALQSALQRRVEFALADAAGVVDRSVRSVAELFPALAGFDVPCDALDSPTAAARWHAWSAALGREANKTPQKAAAAVVDAFLQPAGAGRLATLRKAFFVATEDRLSNNLKKFDAAQAAEVELQLLCAAQAQHSAWQHHHRMARLTRLLSVEFGALKRSRRWVDMGDVERAAQAMLSDPVASGWVQQRLDARVRQLLIDEFQDTNPLQWQALYAWLSGYAGAGGAAAGTPGGPPSVFVVGDPKQSIYRFRRAEPQVFRAAQAFVVDALGGDRLSCDHTRRNAPAVIDAVNAVMLAAQRAGETSDFRAHTTESHDTGAVQLLPPIARSARASGDGDATAVGDLVWRDSLTTPRLVHEDTLRTLECRQAARWLAGQLVVPGQSGGVPAREVMVLSRRRAHLSVLQDELRSLGVATEQPEKTNLGDAPEIQDVVALLDALVSPGHDLSLARALRSPIFGWSDDALVRLAQAQRDVQAATGQRPSWLDLLSKKELLALEYAGLGANLMQYQRWLQALPPHDALDLIYHHSDLVARFAAAAPPAVRATVVARLQALPGVALRLDGARYSTPYKFVRALRSRRIAAPLLLPGTGEVGAVRLLTVHGAKGLEASLVLLLDTDAAPPRAESMGMLIDWPGEAAAPVACLFLTSEARPPQCAQALMAAEQAARQREELNGLYVAMTRARHRLVLSSITPKNAAPHSWWQRLQPDAEALPAPEPQLGSAAVSVDPSAAPAVQLHAVPGLASNVPFAQDLPEQAAIETEALPNLSTSPDAAVGEDIQPPADNLRSRVGQAMHRLLERLPLAAAGATTPVWAADDSAVRAVAREFALDAAAVADAAALAQRVRSGDGAWAWHHEALDWHGNEVALVHGGMLLRIDRLVRRRSDGVWWVFDYKSAWQPQAQDALRQQLALYRDAVRQAHAGASVQAAFLSGDGALRLLD